MEERNYYLGFSLANGIGPITFKKLILHFKTAENAWKASSSELKDAGVGQVQANNFLDFRQKFSFSNYFKLLRQKRAKFVALSDKDYPKLLAKIDSPPSVLFYKGNLTDVNFDKTIGIVGTRRVTNYGTEITQLFSTDLASSGLTYSIGSCNGR